MDTKKWALAKYLKLDNLTTTILAVLLGLIPVFFIPSAFVPPLFAKSILISTGTILALISFLVFLIKKGRLIFPRNLVTYSSIVLVLVYLVSSFFSGSMTGSFFGYGFETGTFTSILLSCLLIFLVSVSFNDSKKIFFAHTVFLSVTLFLLAVQSVFMLFGQGLTPLLLKWNFIGLFANTIGKTGELAVFAGLGVIMSMLVLDLLKPSRVYKILLYAVLVLGLFVVAIISATTIWYLLAAISLLFFVYKVLFLNSASSKMAVVSSDQEDGGTKLQSLPKKISIRVIFVFAIAVFFLLPIGRNISQNMSVKFGVNNFEVRPSWSATYEIYKDTLNSSPLLGSGPNRFGTQWQLFRPDINQSNFWNTNFDFAVGLVPTRVVETGILGTLAWLFFLLSILIVGFKALFTRTTDQINNYFVVSSFVSALFLWAVNIAYPSGPVISGLSFFFTGLLVASVSMSGVSKSAKIAFVGGTKANFVVIVVLVCILISSLGLGYVLVERVYSAYNFQKGSNTIGTLGDFNSGEKLILRATSLVKNDIYYRTLANLYLAKINNLISSAMGKTEVTEAEKLEFSTSLTKALDAAKTAITIDTENFENHEVLARVYATIVPTQIDGSYDGAMKTYQVAVKRSPKNPALYLDMARVEVAKNNLPSAEGFIKKALELKWNYDEAILLQAQIDINKGNLPAAIKSVEQITIINPTDPLAFFRLGLLHYEAKNFFKAVEVFKKSISLVPIYANAKYFLGLSLYKIGQRAEAIKQFEDVRLTNPESREVDAILENLRANREPFADAEVKDVETLDELPLSED